MNQPTYQQGTKVKITRLGTGTVQVDLGPTVIVRFADQIQECRKQDLQPVQTLTDAWHAGQSHAPLDVVVRMQAHAITSINSAWGIFARSRIALLPHQLWVCRKVLQTWPARWLVADDVGLGKTIEAGLILSALISRQRVHRLLVVCPASLVEQWQYRLRTMFDIRTSIYAPDADTPRSDFWNTNPQVVASLHTLRLDSRGRHERMLHAMPWDLVIVDEAHHLNADEQSGPTLGFRLVQRLASSNRIHSMVFFTGTPHRGKPFGFFSLLSLLQPEHFNPRKDNEGQLARLPQVMIRNNKQNVTDLHGKPLFKHPVIQSRTYDYSKAEEQFYNMLTQFIVQGKAYASGLGSRDQRAVMLVLIAMQKLASSSVAAILRALRNRLERISQASGTNDTVNLINALNEAESAGDLDAVNQLDETLAQAELKLIHDEQQWLHRLIDAALMVESETKINAILTQVRSLPEDVSVLFFTEYKATQSLLMSALIAAFGPASVMFINGDGQATDVRYPDGKTRTLRGRREDAAEKFNAAKVRFLVSTEAAGEGIDLQKNCHTLIHVDLPWNPMRLHQRVGRLNRYGQQHKVHITSFRNPSTVEHRIWDKLNEKISHINQALRQVMADPEDLFELVLGMTPPAMFREVFAEAGQVQKDRFDDWFDKKTARFGEQDVIDTVKELVGHCARFDFQSISSKLPKVDLNDLEPFFQGILIHNRRLPRSDALGLSFKTPDVWMTEPAILSEYSGMFFDRKQTTQTSSENLLGVGHKLVDTALQQAQQLEASLAIIPSDRLEVPLLACRVFDRVTTELGQQPAVTCGIQVYPDHHHVVSDWQLLQQLNSLSPYSLDRMTTKQMTLDDKIIERLPQIISDAIAFVKTLDTCFQQPDAELLAAVIPLNT